MADEQEGSEMSNEQQLDHKVTEYLDDVVGTNVASLGKVKVLMGNTLTKEYELRKRLEDAKDNTPVQVQVVLNEGQSSNKSIQDLQNQRHDILENADKKIEKIQPLAEHLSHLANQIANIERFRTYISWIQKLEAVSEGIQENIESGRLASAVHQFTILVAITGTLESSSCENLKAFSQEMQLYWRNVLLSKLSSEFDDVTKAIHWPFTSLSTAPPLSATSEVYQKLERLFMLLLKLQDFKKCQSDDQSNYSFSDILLPIDWLLKPLRKRFKFHFYGEKQTNDKAKPEWFFTLILNWIKSHADFIHHTVQPILDKADIGFVDAKCEFIHGLLKVAIEKMEHYLSFHLEDDILFSHFIDETLLFDQEIHNIYGYTASEHRCLKVLSKPEFLQKWLELEQTYANENLESLMKLSSAWKEKYHDIVNEVDETRTPECAEGVITLLTVITDRYKNLPCYKDQLQFVDVQLQLLQEFINQLNYRAEESHANPVDTVFLSILNATYFVSSILEDWSEQAIFLELSEHRIDSRQNFTKDGETTGLFHERICELKKLRDQMMKEIVENVVKDFRTMCNAYKQERWHSLPPPKELTVMLLSSSACDWLVFLKGRLKILEEGLARGLFSTLWQNIAEHLNRVIYQVILECHFNEGGAAQLQFDMTKHLFTLFGEYTSKPENYFKEVKECCILLNQLQGSAILIVEALSNAQSNDEIDKSHQILNELGVYRLKPQEALRVLSLRINWPKT